MATKVFMEALSPTMEEGRLVKWLKNEGDAVKSGDILAEVETDKAVMELVARGDGLLRRRLVEEGATTPVGALIGIIGASAEDISAIAAAAPPTPSVPADPGTSENGVRGGQPSGESRAAPAPLPNSPLPTSIVSSPSLTPSTPGQPQRSSPLARRIASERGLDLGAISGSGPGGRIIKRDIEAAVTSTASRPSAPPAAPVRQLVAPGQAYQDTPLTQIRKTISRRLSESIGPIPTFYLTSEFDMERVADMRTSMAELGDEFKVSFNDIVIKAVATALAQHPECNAHWLGDHIRYWRAVHIGMAVAIDDGLITPVIFDADTKPLRQLAAESRDLAKRARDRKLKPEEYTGSTFSVSNLGMFGIDQFTAIINPPECGILAVGGIESKPVVVGGAVQIRRRMRVTMSCDHRVIDGALGAKFLQTLRRLMENPLMLVY